MGRGRRPTISAISTAQLTTFSAPALAHSNSRSSMTIQPPLTSHISSPICGQPLTGSLLRNEPSLYEGGITLVFSVIRSTKDLGIHNTPCVEKAFSAKPLRLFVGTRDRIQNHRCSSVVASSSCGRSEIAEEIENVRMVRLLNFGNSVRASSSDGGIPCRSAYAEEVCAGEMYSVSSSSNRGRCATMRETADETAPLSLSCRSRGSCEKTESNAPVETPAHF